MDAARANGSGGEHGLTRYGISVQDETFGCQERGLMMVLIGATRRASESSYDATRRATL